MKEQPDAVVFVEADLDEVVPGTERSQLQPPVRGDLLSAVRAVSFFERGNAGLSVSVANASVVLSGRQGYRLLDRFAQRGQASAMLRVVGSELGANGHHAA